MTTFLQKIKKVKKTGIGNTIIAQIKKAALYILFLIFRFDRWHTMRPYETTNYKKITVRLAQSVSPVTVVDVGCGIGDILRRIQAPERIGIDIDKQALRCAQLLNLFTSPAIVYIEGSITNVDQISQRPIDVLIMTGWIHVQSDAWVEPLLESLFSNVQVRYYIIDEFPAQKGRIEKLFSKYGSIIEKVEDWQDGKTVFLFQSHL